MQTHIWLVCIQRTHCHVLFLIRGDAVILYCCLVLHVLNSECSLCEACCSLLSICQALSLSFPPPLEALWLAAVAILPICSFTYLLLFLALGWWQSGIWVVCLLFHDMLCCVTAAAWSLSLFLLLLHPGSQPTLTYVSASYVLISNLTMLSTLITSSPELFVTLLDTPKHPLPLPQTFVSLSPPNYMLPPHPSSTAGLPGTGPLHTWRDRGLACQPPGEISRVSVTSDLPQNVHQTLTGVWHQGDEQTFFPFSKCSLAALPAVTSVGISV